MNNKPVAWMIKTLDGKKLMLYGEEQSPKFEQEVQAIPLYTHPVKYCPSENNEAYEKGFIDGMAKQRDSAVQQMVEANSHPVKDLTDGEILNMYLEKTNGNKDLDILEFAKEILRKAQEK